MHLSFNKLKIIWYSHKPWK